MTINVARGCHHQINGRFDLTVECIRRYYVDEPSPLSTCLPDMLGDRQALLVAIMSRELRGAASLANNGLS